jgi:hypothetical protein
MLKIFLLFILINSVKVSFSQTAEVVLNKYFDAIGNKHEWFKLKTRIDKYITSRANTIPNEFTTMLDYHNIVFYKVAKRKDSINLVRFISMEENTPYDTSTSSFNGKDYWFQFNNDNPVSPPFDLKGVKFHSVFSHADFFFNAEKILLIGKVKIEDKVCNVLRLTINNKEFDYYFDSQSNYLIMYHPKESNIKTRLLDYRNVEGLMIPFKEEIFNQYGLISSNLLVDIQFNKTIDDNYFDKLIGEGLIIK